MVESKSNGAVSGPEMSRNLAQATGPSLLLRGVRKAFVDVQAVDGLDLEVARGECFGLLGPNGAGRTTTIEICEGLTAPDSGQVELLGLGWQRHAKQLRQRIGIQLQETQFPEKLTVEETLRMFRSFFKQGISVDESIRTAQLEEKRNSRVGGLSGGQKQRLALALALINDPQLVFLDEPTTGLDPQVRVEIHNLLEELKREHRTILMTTHYIEEAERLCDRVAIVDEGRIIALDTPARLQQQSKNASSIVVTCATAFPESRPAWAEATQSEIDATGKTLTVRSRRPAATLVDLVKWIDQHGLELTDVSLKQPSLEDVFIELTGKKLRE